MKAAIASVDQPLQLVLEGTPSPRLVARWEAYPQFRFMGSKHRLLPWLGEVFSQLKFDSALDAFSGSGCVGYLLKTMGKQVTSNDFLNFPTVIARALIENGSDLLTELDLARLLAVPAKPRRFIAETFLGIFFTLEDLQFLDDVSANLGRLKSQRKQALAMAALIRSCLKRQPRGVFTVAGDPERYKDGRRDLRMSLREHFVEQAEVMNQVVFDNGQQNIARCGDVFDLDPSAFDFVYLDPPYVPRADDNCYVKRYHFLEGLSCYWSGLEIVETSRVKKIKKRYTPFSYRRDSLDAFTRLFKLFRESTIALSYSSNGFPDLAELTQLLKKFKRRVTVFERDHRYHFGTHGAVERAMVKEYLILGE